MKTKELDFTPEESAAIQEGIDAFNEGRHRPLEEFGQDLERLLIDRIEAAKQGQLSGKSITDIKREARLNV